MKQVDSYGIIVKCIKVNISRANTKCAKKHIAAYMYVSRKKICERELIPSKLSQIPPMVVFDAYTAMQT